MEMDNKWNGYLIKLIKRDIENGNYTPEEIAVRYGLMEQISKTTKWIQD